MNAGNLNMRMKSCRAGYEKRRGNWKQPCSSLTQMYLRLRKTNLHCKMKIIGWELNMLRAKLDKCLEILPKARQTSTKLTAEKGMILLSGWETQTFLFLYVQESNNLQDGHGHIEACKSVCWGGGCEDDIRVQLCGLAGVQREPRVRRHLPVHRLSEDGQDPVLSIQLRGHRGEDQPLLSTHYLHTIY